MKLHRKRKIEYLGRGGNTNYQAECDCGQAYFGFDWGTADTGIERHCETKNSELRIYAANELYRHAEPGNGHVGNHEDDGTFDRYLAIADYALARGFDPDA